MEKPGEKNNLKKILAALDTRIAALAFAVLIAIIAHAQSSGGSVGITLPETGNPQAQQGLQKIADWVGYALFALRGALAISFWVVTGILIYHVIMAKLMPTRFSRVGALMDAVERVKDVMYAAIGLFIAIYVIVLMVSLAGGSQSGGSQDPLGTAIGIFNWLFVQPIGEAINALAKH